ncbi:MAG: LysM peptidoglycan-binding domain-containing protein [Candidatus Omnitrophica bacterium]|nr:LysM peptidoglycan-binding domain-containing protein [Candidatus Omnitrophota bacterium]
MKKLSVFLALAVMIGVLAGCSVTTKMVTRERVDQELSNSSGNQGYLMGTPPPAGERKPTKTYIEVQVEAPAIEKEDRVPKKVTETSIPSPEPVMNFGAEPVEKPFPVRGAKEGLTDYKVQKGETLQKISMKLYGTTKKWKKLYDLNRDVLKSPDKIRPGMTIKVPATKAAETEGNEYTK